MPVCASLPQVSCGVSPGPRWDVGRKRTTPSGLKVGDRLGVHRAKEKKNQKLLVSKVNSNIVQNILIPSN